MANYTRGKGKKQAGPGGIAAVVLLIAAGLIHIWISDGSSAGEDAVSGQQYVYSQAAEDVWTDRAEEEGQSEPQGGDGTDRAEEGQPESQEGDESDSMEALLGDAESVGWSEDLQEQLYSFRNERLLSQHYDKHGMEMGFATMEEYVAAANAVINHPDALHKLEAEDNDDIYFLEATNEFVVVSTDGYIRTYFIADGGIDYYNRQ